MNTTSTPEIAMAMPHDLTYLAATTLTGRKTVVHLMFKEAVDTFITRAGTTLLIKTMPIDAFAFPKPAYAVLMNGLRKGIDRAACVAILGIWECGEWVAWNGAGDPPATLPGGN